jgi:hypothetical protein
MALFLRHTDILGQKDDVTFGDGTLGDVKHLGTTFWD